MKFLIGWRIGWACAPANIASAIRNIHIKLTDSAPAPFQEAALIAMRSPPTYFVSLKTVSANCLMCKIFFFICWYNWLRWDWGSITYVILNVEGLREKEKLHCCSIIWSWFQYPIPTAGISVCICRDSWELATFWCMVIFSFFSGTSDLLSFALCYSAEIFPTHFMCKMCYHCWLICRAHDLCFCATSNSLLQIHVAYFSNLISFVCFLCLLYFFEQFI